MRPPSDANLRPLDRLLFALVSSFVLSVILKFVPKGVGSDAVMLYSLSSLFDLLTIVFLGAFIIRAIVRWWRTRRPAN